MPDNTLKVVVADDDEPICNLISDILNTFDEVAVIGKAASGKTLLEIVKETSPDVVFVDVCMPELDGLSVVHQLQENHPNLFVVFVTAHTQYAAEAYNLDAADYLVKPVNRSRISRALVKVRRFKELRHSPASIDKEVIPDDCKKISFKIGHGIIVVDLESIYFIEKAGKKCLVHTIYDCYETTEKLSSIEQKLNSGKFFRCHKSFIINTDQVEKILPYADRAYEVTFKNYSLKVTMRREKFEEFCIMLKSELIQ
ncbi:MAG: Transcriptional regulatory protein YpdB [Pelotomaculum sp. PtaU1.Bin035]|nr:MAG: Transcriptional regulatory protein YpdB [Pelotomaculum sp. PtaU1.Bin035]